MRPAGGLLPLQHSGRKSRASRGEYRQAARAMESLTSISSQRSFNRRLNARSRAYNLPRGNQSATAHTINTIKTPIAI